MSEERIKTDEKPGSEKEPLSVEELAGVTGGAAEAGQKSFREEIQKS